MIRFHDGKAAWIKYDVPGYLDKDEQKSLLDLNKGDSEWDLQRTKRTKEEAVLYEKIWLYNSKDKKLQAHLSQPDYPSFTVSIYTAKLGKTLKLFYDQ